MHYLKLENIAWLIGGLLSMSMGTISFAQGGPRPQVDLSVSVSTSPVPFLPDGRATVTLTVHNAGPDTAGAAIPGQDTIYVLEDDFIITTQLPPFEIREPVTGCRADEFVSEPLPNGDIALIFIFIFGPIPAGESRTCTYDIEFYPGTVRSFPTGWLVFSSRDQDTNPANDHVDYFFQVGGVSSVPIPVFTWTGLVGLGLGVLVLTRVTRKRVR